MSYKITVEETKMVLQNVGRKWGVTDTEEVSRDTMFTAGDNEPKTRIKDVMGYTPDINGSVEETTKVYEQVVDALDLVRVIQAVNEKPPEVNFTFTPPA